MDIIAAIDAATGCQHCGGPLGTSPSDDFCSATCQAAWSAARTTPLPHDDEPVELSAHVFNLTELHHPETCADCTGNRWCPVRAPLFPAELWQAAVADLVPPPSTRRRLAFHDFDDFAGDIVSVSGTAPRVEGRTLEAWLNGTWTPAANVAAALGAQPSPVEEGPLTEWEQQLVDGVTDPWEPYEGFGTPAPRRVALAFDGSRNAEVPLAHFLVDEDGTVRANGVIDRRLTLHDFQGLAYGRAHGVVGVDPSGDVIVRPFHLAPWQRAWLVNAYAHGQLRALTGHIAARVEELANTIGPALEQVFRAAGEAVAALAPLADALHQAEPSPPTDPRARALWLRQHRNTGPTRQRRTPRAINARRTR